MSRSVAVVPHTHWDREWYAPFEVYRVRLVAMMDGLLDLLESGRGVDHFHLDGQIALVDDYLDARPEALDRLRKLVAAGRVAVGPWYVLMDEFCVSAETIVRNLQLGMEQAAALGAGSSGDARFVGYLPDMFGHVAQMPQILGQAGIRHAVVWRGVPAAVRRRAFLWRAADGSEVRAEYLPVGYASGAFLPKDGPALVRRLSAYEAEISDFIGPDEPILLMNGGDHQSPQAWLADVLAQANESQSDFRLSQTDLFGFVSSQPSSGLPVWSGELRSGARAPLLMGVLSNRVDIKQSAAAAERELERMAEPLAALWLPPDLWPAGLFDRAWLDMVRNSAHDSICACSADPVVRAVRHRYDAAQAIAEEISASATAIAGVATASAGPLLLNSLAESRGAIVELELPGNEAPPGTQPLEVRPAAVEERHGEGADLGRMLARLSSDGWLGRSGRGVAAELSPGEPARLTIREDASRTPDPAMAAVMAEAWARAGAGRHRPFTVRVERHPSQRVAARVEDVPGWGWALWEAQALSHPPVDASSSPTEVTVDNGLIAISIDRSSGTFAFDGIAGQNLLVEEGDGGDTYNFSPLDGAPEPASRAAPLDVEVQVLEPGPVRARVRVIRRYEWAEGVPVVSDLELCAGDSAVRVTTSFDHRGRDHRVRAVFPLGQAVATTEAECAFATVVRGGAEGGPHEPALATFPSRRFVTAGDLTVTHEGLLEYELVDGGTALALTLLRAVGVLSRPAPPARPVVAGPEVAVPDAQMPGPQMFSYALARRCPDPWALADRMWTPLVVVAAGGHGHLPDRGSRLELKGAKVSALYRRRGAIEIRVFNPGTAPTTVEVPGRGGTLVDLRGEVVAEWAGSFRLGPGAFATARLTDMSLD